MECKWDSLIVINGCYFWTVYTVQCTCLRGILAWIRNVYKMHACSTEMIVITRDIAIMTSNGGKGWRWEETIGLYRNVYCLPIFSSGMKYLYCPSGHTIATSLTWESVLLIHMLGKFPTVRSSDTDTDTDTDLPIVSASFSKNLRSDTDALSLQPGGFKAIKLLHWLKYFYIIMMCRFIAPKWRIFQRYNLYFDWNMFIV